MGFRVAGLAALIAGAALGCVEEHVSKCANALCPSTKVCDDTYGCVFPEQRVACASAEDGSACSYGRGVAGSCEGAVCLALGCGNGLKTSDEQCDDGNNTNGDGCSADCRSDETCGNQVVDLAKFEQCDDGNKDNFDDCRNDCVLPHCNDGLVDPLEECDPGAAAALTSTCDTFGYYGGALTCSATCRFDPSTCTGKCGDDVVQSEFGEECDGGLPAFTCTDAGFDFGAITCKQNTCTADTAQSCERFGWRHVRDSPYPRVIVPNQPLIAADQGLIALVEQTSDDIRVLELDGTISQHAMTAAYVAVDVRGSTILAATATAVELRVQGTWTTLPAPAVSSPIMKAVLAADGTPIVLAPGTSTSQVGVFDGTTWSMTSYGAKYDTLYGFAADDFVLVQGTSLTWTHSGGPTTMSSTTGEIVDVVRTADGLDVYTFTNSVTAASDVVSKQAISAGGAVGAAATVAQGLDGTRPLVADGALFDMQAETGGPNLYALRMMSGRVEQFTLPPQFASAAPALYASRDGTLYGVGNPVGGLTGVGLYVPSAFAPTTRPRPSGLTFNGATIGLADDGTLLACDSVAIYIATDLGWVSHAYSPNASVCLSITGRSATDVRLTLSGGTNKGIFTWNGSTLTPTGVTGAARVAGSGGVYAAVLLASGGVQIEASGSWSDAPPPSGCSARAVAVAEGGTVYAGGYCGTAASSKIWRRDGGVWTEVDTKSSSTFLGALFVAADGTMFEAYGADLDVVKGGTRQTFPITTTRLAGTSSTDVYAIAQNQLAPLVHWDGARWSPIQSDPSMMVLGLAANTRDVDIVTWTTFAGLVRP